MRRRPRSMSTSGAVNQKKGIGRPACVPRHAALLPQSCCGDVVSFRSFRRLIRAATISDRGDALSLSLSLFSFSLSFSLSLFSFSSLSFPCIGVRPRSSPRIRPFQILREPSPFIQSCTFLRSVVNATDLKLLMTRNAYRRTLAAAAAAATAAAAAVLVSFSAPLSRLTHSSTHVALHRRPRRCCGRGQSRVRVTVGFGLASFHLEFTPHTTTSHRRRSTRPTRTLQPNPTFIRPYRPCRPCRRVVGLSGSLLGCLARVLRHALL